MDQDEQVQWTLRLKIELEHYDLIERRNAALVLETAFPIALLTLAFEIGILNLSNLPYFVIAAVLSFYCIHMLFTERYSEELKKLHGELEKMVLTLKKTKPKKEKSKPRKTILHIVIVVGEAMILSSVFIPSLLVAVTGLTIASAGFLTVIYRQHEEISASLKKFRERISIPFPF